MGELDEMERAYLAPFVARVFRCNTMTELHREYALVVSTLLRDDDDGPSTRMAVALTDAYRQRYLHLNRTRFERQDRPA
jgi:hypothetical protein